MFEREAEAGEQCGGTLAVGHHPGPELLAAGTDPQLAEVVPLEAGTERARRVGDPRPEVGRWVGRDTGGEDAAPVVAHEVDRSVGADDAIDQPRDVLVHRGVESLGSPRSRTRGATAPSPCRPRRGRAHRSPPSR